VDGKGTYNDNLFIERLWRTVKYEEVYLKAYEDGREAKAALAKYFRFYNNERPHQALGYRTPAAVYNSSRLATDPASLIAPKGAPRTAEPHLSLASVLSQ
jgi:putative transposase